MVVEGRGVWHRLLLFKPCTFRCTRYSIRTAVLFIGRPSPNLSRASRTEGLDNALFNTLLWSPAYSRSGTLGTAVIIHEEIPKRQLMINHQEIPNEYYSNSQGNAY